jgi:hypothetical protein
VGEHLLQLDRDLVQIAEEQQIPRPLVLGKRSELFASIAASTR